MAVVVGVGGVDDEGVNAGIDKRGGALIGLLAGTNARGNQQAAGSILGGVGVLLGFDEVLDGNKANELVICISDRQLFYLIGRQQL